MNEQLLHRYAQFLAIVTFALIVAGGLVTSTGSGLSVPDWPLSYGQFFPPMIGGIRFEHTHRVIAGSVGILTLFFTMFVLKNETRLWVRWLGVAASVAVVAQAILGGLTVKYLLPTAVSVAHACLAQTFFALIACLIVFTSSEWRTAVRQESANAGSVQRLVMTTTAFIYLQLVLGAVVRHTHGKTVGAHMAVAFLIILHSLFIVLKIAMDDATYRRLARHALALASLVFLQIFLGIGAFVFRVVLEPASMPRSAEVLLATAHQATGALILATAATLMFRSFRLFQATERPGRSYLALTKPKLTLLALATTLLGFALGSGHDLKATLLLHTLCATFLIGGGANALNQFFEKDVDARMTRTQNRPLPSGKLLARHVLIFGALLSVAGTLQLFFFVNTLTALLGFLTVSSYVFLYTPLKRWTPLNTFVGGIPGAIPCVMGWTAAGRALGVEALVLFLILFLWQLPHFFAIAWVYREDYERGGFKMISGLDQHGTATCYRIFFYSALLALSTWMPVLTGLGGRVYLSMAAVAGLALMAFASTLFVRGLGQARRFVSVSIYYLLAIIAALLVDKWL